MEQSGFEPPVPACSSESGHFLSVQFFSVSAGQRRRRKRNWQRTRDFDEKPAGPAVRIHFAPPYSQSVFVLRNRSKSACALARRFPDTRFAMARSRAWIRSLVLAVSDCPVLLSGVRRINSGYFNFKGMVEFRNYKIMRQTSSVIIGWVTRNERDLIIAFVFAIIGAVFWDAVKTGSIAGVRQLKNKLAEQSVARLQERIVQLQKYRDTINSYISSDRALYLATLQLILAILILACMGAAAVILDSLLPLQELRLSVVALFIFAIAIILGMYGVQLAKLSTRSELSAKVSALDSEINALKAKLDLRTRKVAQ
jgi:uncharacterized small protein (DUF1192 family)